DVQDRRVLEAVVLLVEVASTRLVRGGVLFVIRQFGEAPGDGLALGDGLQVGFGDLVLGVNPRLDLVGLADVVFEPAVGVGDLGAVVVIDVVDAFGLRVGEGTVVGRDNGCGQQRQQGGTTEGAFHE